MTWEIALGCIIIIIARVGDVSLGTMRTVAVVSGHRGVAWLLGLLEMTIWVFVVSAVIAHIRAEPAYGIAFAFGAATGNYIGVTLQGWLPFGSQVVRVFTRDGAAMFERLRRDGFGVTKFQGEGRDGAVAMLFVQVGRARTRHVLRAAREVDPRCYYTIDDIRVANATGTPPSSAGGRPSPFCHEERRHSVPDSSDRELLRAIASQRRDLTPEVSAAFQAFQSKVFAEGALDRKTKQIIAVAVAHVTQCHQCIQSHTKAALQDGATPQEMMEAVWVAAEMRAGGSYAHSNVMLAAINGGGQAGGDERRGTSQAREDHP